MAVDERTVDQIIAETLNRHGGEGCEDPDVWEAQNELYDKRTYDPALAGNENYVIAEHYMLSRALVATGQLPIEQLLAQVETYTGPQAGTPAAPLPETAVPADASMPAAALAARKVAQGAWDGEAQRVRTGTPKPDANPKAVAICNAFHKILKR